MREKEKKHGESERQTGNAVNENGLHRGWVLFARYY